ncbi:uncharacterized protein LOC144648701 [Oculina patagonica]
MVEVKAEAIKDLFKPAPAIVNEVLLKKLDGPSPSLSKPKLLAQAANRLRQNTRPKDPVDMDFSLEEDHIPDGFLQADVTVNSRRHRVFATQKQLEFLSKAKTWFMDGIFKLFRHPFT